MGILYKTIQVPNKNNYAPEYNKDGTEKHIALDGARFHVISYALTSIGAVRSCSCKNCEINKKDTQL